MKTDIFLSNPEGEILATKLANQFGVKFEVVKIGAFANNEHVARLQTDFVTTRHVMFIAGIGPDLNVSLWDLMLSLEVIKKNSPASLTLLIPLLPYSRQDRDFPLESSSAMLLAKLLEQTGIDRLITLDTHSELIKNFYSIPFHDLLITDRLLDRLIDEEKPANPVLFAADIGGANKLNQLAKDKKLEFCYADKTRPEANKSVINSIHGDVAGKDIIIVEDMIDTGGTILSLIKVLKFKKVNKIYVIATHGLFSGLKEVFLKNISDNKLIDKLYLSNSFTSELAAVFSKYKFIKVFNISEFIAADIKQIKV